MQLTRNFHLSEFASGGPQGPRSVPVPPELWPNVKELAENLQTIRDSAGRLAINSAYRTQEHNRRVKGSPTSQHLKGKAADLRPLDISPNQLYNLILDLIQQGKIKNGGVGRYDTFVHYDTRETPARWDYRKKKAKN